MLFLKFILSPVRYAVPYNIFSKYSLFSTSNLSDVTFSDKSKTEVEEDYKRRKIAMTQFLLAECGFSESKVLALARRNERLFRTRSTKRAQEAVQFLRETGFTLDQVRKILFRHPYTLVLKVDTQLQPKIEFVKALGFTVSDMVHIICRQPRFLAINLEQNLSHKIPVLVSLFGSKINLCKALLWQPGILLYRFDNLKSKIDILKQSRMQDELFLYLVRVGPNLISNSEEELKLKIEYVRNLGILEGSKAFALALAAVDSSGLQNFKNKLKHMATFGLLENEIIQIVKKSPRTLTNAIDKLENNMDFLKRTAGFQPSIVVLYPRLLSYSIENRMRPRHEVIEFLRKTEPSRLPTNLARLYEISEQTFNHKFLVGSPEAAKLFENYKGKSVDLATS